MRTWYKERYCVKHLNKEPIFAWRIREEGTERVVAAELTCLDADFILELVHDKNS